MRFSAVLLRRTSVQMPEFAPKWDKAAMLIRRRLRARQFAQILAETGEETGKNERKIEEPGVSLAAEQFLRHNSPQIFKGASGSLIGELMESLDQRQELAWRKLKVRKKKSHTLDYPLHRHAGTVNVDPGKYGAKADASIKKQRELKASFVDRGFHVASAQHRDEYFAGTCREIDDETYRLEKSDYGMNSSDYEQHNFPVTIEPTEVSLLQRVGPEEAVEEISFQLPNQESHTLPTSGVPPTPEEEQEQEDKYYWLQKYGNEDESVAASEFRCGGCGAAFHCQRASLPGFLPSQLFLEKEKTNFEDTLCRRCYLLKHHDFLLNVSVAHVDYAKVMGHLRELDNVLILLIVDLLDVPASIHRNLHQIVGAGKPMIVLGNKLDLLPPDARPGYLKRYRKSLIEAMQRSEFHRNFNILETVLISAKTGYGIEELITLVQSKWGTRGDIYVVGCTNSGKSTLFNTLIQSDMCKVRAVDLVERATASLWPGTTLSLLKFPVMQMTPLRIKRREKRLRSIKRFSDVEAHHRRQLLQQSRDSKYALIQGYVGRTVVEEDNPQLAKVETAGQLGFVNTDLDQLVEERDRRLSRTWDPEGPQFRHGRWLYDTPGTVNEGQVAFGLIMFAHENYRKLPKQIINQLTLEELVTLAPSQIIRPRIAVLKTGQSLLMGGVARLDMLEGAVKPFARLAIFASEKLPIHILKSHEVEGFCRKYAGTKVLPVPTGDARRLAKFPKLEGEEMAFRGDINSNECVADVVLSSAGWFSVAPPTMDLYRFIAYTPGRLGLEVRRPALVPYALELRKGRLEEATATRGDQVFSTKTIDQLVDEQHHFYHPSRKAKYRRPIFEE